jgi:hypothetical protein
MERALRARIGSEALQVNLGVGSHPPLTECPWA